MKIPIVTCIDTDAIKADALRQCTLENPSLRDAFALGVDVAMLAIGREFSLRMETLRMEMEKRA